MQDLSGTRDRSPELGMCSHSDLCNTRTKGLATHDVGTGLSDTQSVTTPGNVITRYQARSVHEEMQPR